MLDKRIHIQYDSKLYSDVEKNNRKDPDKNDFQEP